VEVTAEASKQISQIIGYVKELTPQFSNVNEGMHAQSLGADEISVSMRKLNQDTEQTMISLNQLNNSAESLQQASNNLNEQISKFKI